MDIFNIIGQCLLGTTVSDDKAATTNTTKQDIKAANDIVDIIYNSEKSAGDLKAKLRSTIRAYSWTENLGKAILNALDAAVREGRAMSPALKEAHEKACDAANAVGGFVKEHPVFCTVIVLGILVLLMPWVIEAVGFGAEGPIAGEYFDFPINRQSTDKCSDSFAASWQARYLGYVPKGSLFSYFQRLGMTWHY